MPVSGTGGIKKVLNPAYQALKKKGEYVYEKGSTSFRLRAPKDQIKLSDFDPPGYSAELERMTEVLVEGFRAFIQEKEIDLILSQNIWCVAANPAVAKALETVRREYDLPAISHNHDFYWERVGGLSLTCAPAIELMDKYLPPHDPSIKHAVINSLAQIELKERKGIPSLIVPNVFDFETPPWEVDDYNSDLRSEIGLKKNDLVILQATRIVSRKGIELAIDFTRALNTLERRELLVENGLFDGRKFTKNNRIVLAYRSNQQSFHVIGCAGHYYL